MKPIKHFLKAYGGAVQLYLNCRFSFPRFESADFNFNGKERPGGLKKFEDNGLQDLLGENPIQISKELSN